MGDHHAHGHHHDHGGPALTSQRMQRILTVAVLAVLAGAVIGLVLLRPESGRPTLAAELGQADELVDATVTAVAEIPCAGTEAADGILCNEVRFRVTEGSTDGDTGRFQLPISEATVQLEAGDRVVLSYQAEVDPEFQYRFADFQRQTPMLLLVGLFVVCVLALGRWQGLRALLALGVTGVVMVGFLFPSVLDGHDPTTVALVAAAIIGMVALYLTHGINERSTVALLGTYGALGLTAVLAAVFSSAARFTGFSTEDAFYLQVASTTVDIPGLVLAGIIIGSLGVLDDVTVTQVSAVWQLHQANPALGARQLYRSAVEIGRDHIASTVNTLVLAYAGASLPLLLLFTQAGRRLADVAVGELVAVEIVRTLVGSVGLVAAVPLTTGLAALVITRGRGEPPAVGELVADEPSRDPEPAAPPPTPAPAPPPGVAEVPAEGAPDDDPEAWGRFAPDDEPGW